MAEGMEPRSIMAGLDAAQELMIFVLRTLPGYLRAQTLWNRSHD